MIESYSDDCISEKESNRNKINYASSLLYEAMPNNVDAEKQAISILFNFAEESETICDIFFGDLTSQHFFNENAKKVFESCREMYNEGLKDFNEVILVDKLFRKYFKETSYKSFIESCCDMPVSPSIIDSVLNILKDRKSERDAIDATIKSLKLIEKGQGRQVITRSISIMSEHIPFSMDEKDPIEKMQEEIEDEIAGTRFALPFPGIPLLQKTRALLPGTLTMICGEPGSSKSLFLINALIEWTKSNFNCAALFLEKSLPFYFRRALALLSEESWLATDDGVRKNPQRTEELKHQHIDFLRRLHNEKVFQCPRLQDDVDIPTLLGWIRRESRHRQLLVVDPITYITSDNNKDDKDMVKTMQRILTENECALILVTHPKTEEGRRTMPNQDKVAGHRSFRQFSDSIFWLQPHSLRTKEMLLDTGEIEECAFNKTWYNLKVRGGRGTGDRYAIMFNELDLKLRQQGKLITKATVKEIKKKQKFKVEEDLGLLEEQNPEDGLL